eukprot:7443687-Pyramimonas_sp.AAC.1
MRLQRLAPTVETALRQDLLPLARPRSKLRRARLLLPRHQVPGRVLAGLLELPLLRPLLEPA